MSDTLTPSRLWTCSVCCARCDWTTVKPEHAARSAREAHRIGHEKGWFPDA